MVNVKQRLYLSAIGILSAAYLAFLAWDHDTYDFVGQRGVVDAHLANIDKGKEFDGLIIGGSNALFSLSAAGLSQAIGGRWYNASLLNAGHSNKNFKAFIDQVGGRADRSKVKYIVYSSMYLTRPSDIVQRNDISVGIEGARPLSVRPYRSALSYVREHVLGEDRIVYPLPTSQGDFDFGSYRCVGDAPGLASARTEPNQINVDFLAANLRHLHHVFPNARVYVVIPSELSPPTARLDLNGAANKLRLEVAANLKADAGMTGFAFHVIAQPDFKGKQQLCDSVLHANAQGRDWRTADLLSRLRSLNDFRS